MGNKQSNPNQLRGLSYYEMRCNVGDLYIGARPCAKSSPPLTSMRCPQDYAGRQIFGTVTYRHVHNFIEALNKSNHGLAEHLGWLCGGLLDGAQIDAQRLVEHLESLYIVSASRHPAHDELIIGSRTDSAYLLVGYARDRSAAHCDTWVYTLYAGLQPDATRQSIIGSTLEPILGTIQCTMSKEIQITYPDKPPQTILSTGHRGYMVGTNDKLTLAESQQIQSLVDENTSLIRSKVMRINGQYPARTCRVTNHMGIFLSHRSYMQRFLIGLIDKPRHNPQYSVYHGVDGTYGYSRYTSTVVLADVVYCDTLPVHCNPSSPIECIVPKPVLFSHLCKMFNPHHAYPPAIHAHIEQLKMVRRALPVMGLG